jgi:drug/metabolite transporter (DMT)-like permease
MSLLPFALVLLAAIMHATWNALIKVNDDRLVATALMTGVTGIAGLLMLPFVPFPNAEAWPFLIVTTFVHTGYLIFLVRAYTHGDFGQVYPIARGTAPLLSAIASVALLGEVLSLNEWIAVALIGGGIVSLAIHGIGTITHNPKGVAYAFVTAGFIATYTIIDASGARASNSVNSYAVWLFFLHGIPMVSITLILRGRRFWTAARAHWRPSIFGGIISFLAYWIVLWALTFTNVAPVAALRETSVIFAAVIAALFLKEQFGWQRIAAASIVATGVILLAISP